MISFNLLQAFDITPLQIPIGAHSHEMMVGKMPPCKNKYKLQVFYLLKLISMVFADMMKMPAPEAMMGGEPNVGVFIDDHKRRADHDPNAPPFDDLRNYAYEGGGSTGKICDLLNLLLFFNLIILNILYCFI